MPTRSTLAIAATFTAEPIAPTLSRWLDRLELDADIAFAPYNQVFQQLLDSDTLLSQNRGLNVLLVRFEDWIRSHPHAHGPGVPTGLTPAVSPEWPRHRLPNGLEVAHLNRDETEHLYRELFLNRAYLRHGITLRDGACIVDAGANIGMFSLFASTACRHPRIFAFEPIPAVASLLRTNAALHDLDLKVFECGLGERHGDASFTYYENFSVVSGFQADETEDATFLRDAIQRSLARDRAPTASTDELTELLVTRRLARQQMVLPVRRLSDVLRAEAVDTIDLLKIDVEKSELALMAGIDEDDWVRVQQVVMEIHDRDDAISSSVSLLERHGFDVVVEEEQDLRSTGVWNLFATRREYRDVIAAQRRERFAQMERNVADLAEAVAASTSRAAPFVLICCPPSSFAAADAESRAMIARSEAQLRDRLAPLGVSIVSGLESVATYDCPDYYDSRGDDLGHMPFTADGAALVATLVARAAHARLTTPAKVVVLDCDNTLWSGVCAEDGALGVVIDAARAALQRKLVALHEAGVLICLCSKNEPADVWAVFDAHPDMVLQRAHVLAARINWQPKSRNLQELAQELDLGMDSFVLIDDNPVECAEVQTNTPEVVVLQWPANDRQAARFSEHLWRLDQARNTAEDARRNTMYKQAAARRQFQRSGITLEDFLETLKLEITIAPMTPEQLPRASQMTERTNQFNFTTIRRSELELRSLAADGALIQVVDVRDRFGDYGLVGEVITRVDSVNRALVVDTFLLSCRVLGKGVEHEVVKHLGRVASTEGLARIELPFRRTARNTPALVFAESLNAERQTGADGEAVYVLGPEAARTLPFKTTAATTDEADEIQPRPSERTTDPRRLSDSSLYQQIATELTTAKRIAEILTNGRAAAGGARADSVPPSSLESRLTTILAEQLRLNQVGVHDNFFDLGGDSIVAIQVMSRAAQAGIRIGMRDLFQHPTVAELARVLSARTDRISIDAETEADDREIPLTPIQEWFFEKQLPAPQHWNMELSIRSGAPIDPTLLERALAVVMTHHAALRFRYSLSGQEWRQRVGTSADGGLVEGIDLTGLSASDQAAAMRDAARRAHASLDLVLGPLVRFVVFRLDAGVTQVLVVVHHLVIDGVSLRILVSDLETAYQQLARGIPLQLPDASTTYASWARKLRSYAQSSELAAESDYWTAILRASGPALPTDDAARRHEGLERDLQITPSFLSADETQCLLQDLPRVYQTQINDALLTALAQAFHRWSGQTTLLVDLEGHGREDLFEAVDLTRTIGWFTSIFPVRLRGDFSDPREALFDTRATLRQVPNRGIGYGILRYLSSNEALRSELAGAPQPEVMFNYLGQFDRAGGPASLFEIHDNVDFGPLHGPLGKRSHLFEIIARVVGGRLRLDWMYPRNVFREGTARLLIDHYQASIRELIGLARAMPDAQEPAIRRLSGGRAVEEVCPLSPIQELFLAVGSSGSTVGVDQWQLTLEGPLDEPRFRRAWEETVQRHSILRTAIAIEGLAAPQQVVFRDAELEWHHEDWRQLDVATQRTSLESFTAAERNRPFQLDRPPLMRVALFKTSDNESHLLWTFHHLIIDGWSCPLVFSSISAAYEALVRGMSDTASIPARYAQYIAWLAEQPTGVSEAFWRRTLAHMGPTPLPPPLESFVGSGEPSIDATVCLSANETAGLHTLARREHASLNTLVQLAWALVLSRHSGNSEVTFGVAFSGRPPSLAGVETIVGPFVNNLPVRVRIEPSMQLAATLRGLQELQFDLAQHQFTPLAKIESLASRGTAGRLFESLLVLQSYTAADALTRLGSQLRVARLVAPVQTNYPLTVVANPGDRLQLSVIARGEAYDRPSLESIASDLTLALLGIATLDTAGEVMARLAKPRSIRVIPRAVRLRKADPSPPRLGLESAIAAIWRRALGLDDIGTNENFFDLGGQSLLMLQVHQEIRALLQSDVSIVTMFRYPTIRQLAQHLEGATRGETRRPDLADRGKRQSAALARHRSRAK